MNPIRLVSVVMICGLLAITLAAAALLLVLEHPIAAVSPTDPVAVAMMTAATLLLLTAPILGECLRESAYSGPRRHQYQAIGPVMATFAFREAGGLIGVVAGLLTFSVALVLIFGAAGVFLMVRALPDPT